jgi:hypothetical protein
LLHSPPIIAVLPAPTLAQEKSLATVEVVDQRGAQAECKNSEIQKIVIAGEEVEHFGDATVGDVLRRLPGTSFTGPAGVTKHKASWLLETELALAAWEILPCICTAQTDLRLEAIAPAR